jgi:hypothetical protein
MAARRGGDLGSSTGGLQLLPRLLRLLPLSSSLLAVDREEPQGAAARFREIRMGGYL